MTFVSIGRDEEAYLDIVNTKFHRGFTLFDVGASLGNYTDMVRHRTRKHISAHLFEPRYEAFGDLKEKYSCDERTILNNVAVGDRPREAMIEVCDHLEHSHITNSPIGKFECVDIIKLDDYLTRTVIEGNNAFLKIDTEGFEMEVLQGAQTMIRHYAKAVQFEYGGTWLRKPWHLEEVRDLLPGFTIYRYEQGGVLELDDFTDHYSYTNYLALRP